MFDGRGAFYKMPLRKPDSPTPPDSRLSWLPPKGKRAPKLPGWLPFHRLPPLVCGGSILTEEELALLVSKLKEKEVFTKLASILSQEAEAGSLDHFLAAAFELWRGYGGKSADRWVFLLTAWGGEACSVCLGNAVRQWAKDLNRVRANEGIEFLQKIGLTTAIMEISNVSQSTKRASIARKANAALLDCAVQRGLTLLQLEDRIVPDCGLDIKGKCCFDFGPRKYFLKLLPSLDLKITDEAGTVRDDLPKPLKSDDPVLAAASVAKWKMIKKQLRTTFTTQSRRMELAMGGGRRWSYEEFQNYFLNHPVMQQLARRLVWGAYDETGTPRVFRIVDDLTFADARDEAMDLPQGVEIGLPHPLHIPEGELESWKSICVDYQIIQPFEQLTRWKIRLKGNAGESTQISLFDNKSIDGLFVGLESSGWTRLGLVAGVGKVWPSVQHMAVVEMSPPPMDYGTAFTIGQRVTRFYFIKWESGAADFSWSALLQGVEDAGNEEEAGSSEQSDSAGMPIVNGMEAREVFLHDHPPLPLRDVDERVISDAVRDVQMLFDRQLLAKI